MPNKVRQNERIDTGFIERLNFCANLVKNYSQLSEKTGISKSTLSDYKSGKVDPSRIKLIEIANAAGVNVGWLATGEESTAQNESETDSASRFHTKTVEQAAAALYGYLEKNKTCLSPEIFGETVALICSLIPEGTDIDAKLIERLMKFKGK